MLTVRGWRCHARVCETPICAHKIEAQLARPKHGHLLPVWYIADQLLWPNKEGKYSEACTIGKMMIHLMLQNIAGDTSYCKNFLKKGIIAVVSSISISVVSLHFLLARDHLEEVYVYLDLKILFKAMCSCLFTETSLIKRRLACRHRAFKKWCTNSTFLGRWQSLYAR